MWGRIVRLFKHEPGGQETALGKHGKAPLRHLVDQDISDHLRTRPVGDAKKDGDEELEPTKTYAELRAGPQLPEDQVFHMGPLNELERNRRRELSGLLKFAFQDAEDTISTISNPNYEHMTGTTNAASNPHRHDDGKSRNYHNRDIHSSRYPTLGEKLLQGIAPEL